MRLGMRNITSSQVDKPLTWTKWKQQSRVTQQLLTYDAGLQLWIWVLLKGCENLRHKYTNNVQYTKKLYKGSNKSQ